MILLLKKLFNSCVNEKKKEQIREKCKKLFICMDKRLYYKKYMQACKYILRTNIWGYKESNYDYRYTKDLIRIKELFIECSLRNRLSEIEDGKTRESARYIGEKGYDVYCGALDKVHPYTESDIGYDTENQLYYGWYEGKKLYFSKNQSTKEEALQYLNGLAGEQSEHSPHKYLADDFKVKKGGVVFDLGSAEGNFALSVIEQAGEVYLFEYAEQWVKPLELTFAPYKEKVHIIRKYVSDYVDEQMTTIDTFCKENGIDTVDFIKMDVEGAERNILTGASEMIKAGAIKKMAICTYHRFDDARVLSEMLPDYKKDWAEGHMILVPPEFWESEFPYITKGLMRASLKGSE